ncbi:MAG: hypothetical protein AAF715_15385 [Myxococcota bacterium]
MRRCAWLALGLGYAAAACAAGTGGSEDDDDGRSGGTGAQGPGSTGTQMRDGGAGPSTSNGGSHAGGGDAGAGGMLPPCDESPCKLTSPQCGCPSGEACVLANDGGRICIEAGTAAIGEACGNGNNCAPGSVCVSVGQSSNTVSVCREFCTSDGDCSGPGGGCWLQLQDNMMNPIPDLMCTENCDFISNAGCPVGTKCIPVLDEGPPERSLSICASAGTLTQGATCVDTFDCAPGYGCIDFTDAMMNMRTECARYANAANPVCDSPTDQFSGFTTPLTIGSVTYGVCLTP